MKVVEHKPTGMITRDMTVAEMKAAALRGDRMAIKELVNRRGGWDALTDAQRTKVTRLLIGEEVTL